MQSATYTGLSLPRTTTVIISRTAHTLTSSLSHSYCNNNANDPITPYRMVPSYNQSPIIMLSQKHPRHALSPHSQSIAIYPVAKPSNNSKAQSGVSSHETRSSDGVPPINTQIRPSNVPARLTQQKSDSAHEVLWLTHFALGDQGDPVFVEVRVVIEDLLGSGYC